MYDLYKSVDSKGRTFEEYMRTYDESLWMHPSVSIDIILITQIKGEMYVLLTKRTEHPYVGCWALPGSFVGYDESLDLAVERTITNKAGIHKNLWYRQMHTFGNPERDPRTRVITTSYLSLVNSEELGDIDANSNSALFKVKMRKISETDTKRMSVITLENSKLNVTMQYRIVETMCNNWLNTDSTLDEAMSSCELAGDHIKLIHNSLVYLENNSSNYGVILNLLPEQFSLGDVQKVYEDITGKKQIAGNFRLSLLKSGMIVETGNTRVYRGRNVALYTANKLKMCSY